MFLFHILQHLCFHPVLDLQNNFPVLKQGGRNKWQLSYHKSFSYNARKRGRKLTCIKSLVCAKHGARCFSYHLILITTLQAAEIFSLNEHLEMLVACLRSHSL